MHHKILIFDDCLSTVFFLKHVIFEDHDVDDCKSMNEYLSAIEKNRYSYIICDMHIDNSDVNGIDLLKMSECNAKKILLTMDDTTNTRNRCIESNIIHVLKKDVINESELIFDFF